MSKTIHSDNYKIVNRPTNISDKKWNSIFAKKQKNDDKNKR